MVLVALMFTLLFGIAAISVDGSLNYLDRRALRAASDAGALSGAGVVSQGKAVAQNTAMRYAFQNLGITLPGTAAYVCTGDVANPGGFGADECQVSFGGYTITVQNSYTSPNTAANPYEPDASVAVDIQHQKPQSGFAGVMGVTTVTVGSHSAATSQTGFRNFPFAVAARLMSVQGSNPSVVYGAVVLRDCAGQGTGSFALQGGQNGGLFINGGSSLVLGRSIDSSVQPPTGGANQSAQALLGESRSGANCSGAIANQNPLVNSTGAKNNVNFDPNDPSYNFAYGFNSGPGGCSDQNVAGFAASCQASPIGTTPNPPWEDQPCWSANQETPVQTTTGFYDALSDSVTSGTTSPCANNDSHEGSFDPQHSITIPQFPGPVDIVNQQDNLNQIPATNAGLTATTVTGGSYQFSKTRVFTSGSANGATLKFGPGWYIFDGAFTVSPKSFQCLSSLANTSPPIPSGYNGCVFVFRNGASLDVSGNGTDVQCGKDATHPGCAFQFSDGSGTNYATLKLHQQVNVAMAPATYTPASGVNSRCNGVAGAVCMPLIYSADTANCVSTGGQTCAVDLQNSGSTFDMQGTIFVPSGVYSSVSNAAPSSGQVIADTIILQGGSSSGGSGVAYKSAVIAPIPGAPFLFE